MAFNSVQELFAFKAKLTTSSSGDHSLSLGDINHEYNGAEIDVTLNCEQDDAYFVYISNDIYDEYWNSGGYAIDYYFPSSNYSKVKIDGGSSQGEYWVGFWVWNDPGNFGVGRRTSVDIDAELTGGQLSDLNTYGGAVKMFFPSADCHYTDCSDSAWLDVSESCP